MVVLNQKGGSRPLRRLAVGMGFFLTSLTGFSASDSANQLGPRPLADSPEGIAAAFEDAQDRIPMMSVSDAEIRRQFRFSTIPSNQVAVFSNPSEPKLGGYSSEKILQTLDRSRVAQVSLLSIVGEAGFAGLFSLSSVGLSEIAKRQGSALKAIVIENGYITPQQMIEKLPPEALSVTKEGKYVVNLPILIRHGAILHVDKNTKQLRLAQESGSLIVVEGTFVVTDSEVVGWSTKANAAAQTQSGVFRPFIIGWGGSKSYVVNSQLTNLGYGAEKASGFALSQYGDSMVDSKIWPKPTAWLINSKFERLWYGVYASDAEDLVVQGSTIKDSAVYGIEIVSGSKRSVIAKNSISGTKTRHGIFLTRNSGNSWIVENKIFNNKLSGIVISRNASNILVAKNSISKNGADGIAFAETKSNIAWENLVSGNGRNGIHVRNSQNIRLEQNVVVANEMMGIFGSAVTLQDGPAGIADRSYVKSLEMIVQGGQYTSNGIGPLGLQDPTKVIYNALDLRAPQRKLGFKLSGALLPFQIDFFSAMAKEGTAVLIEKQNTK